MSFASILAAQPKPKLNQKPENAKFVVSDIDNFWRAFDLAAIESTTDKKIEIFQREYFDKGSDGLKSFIQRRIQSSQNLVKKIELMPKYYSSIRYSTLSVSKARPKFIESFKRLQKIYPDAVFPDVYFLVGRASSGGTLSDTGLLIGTEMYGLTPNTPREELGDWLNDVLKPIEDIPAIVAHELIHYQQDFGSNRTLLERSLKEGGADFIGEMISGKNINGPAYKYGYANESQLWIEFSAERDSEKAERWLFNGGSIKDRPADLGYFIGYRICQAYYERSSNKKQALADILKIKDASEFLKRSGYGK